MNKLTIGTRASALALWQANHVKHLIESRFKITVDLKKISTKGDQIQDRSLMEIGGKGLFLKEIEEELLSGTIDIAVHSMKDVPFELPEGLVLGAILQREDPSDAFLSVHHKAIQDLKEGQTVGTSSMRRMVQLQSQYPHLVFKPLRGNVDTRIKKMQAGEFDAIILASAGLIRLELSNHIRERLDIVSAVGQGAVGVEYMESRDDLSQILSVLNHSQTQEEVNWERYFSKHLQGDCQTPLGCFVKTVHDQEFEIKYFFARSDGTNFQSGHKKCVKKDMPKVMSEIVSSIQK